MHKFSAITTHLHWAWSLFCRIGKAWMWIWMRTAAVWHLNKKQVGKGFNFHSSEDIILKFSSLSQYCLFCLLKMASPGVALRSRYVTSWKKKTLRNNIALLRIQNPLDCLDFFPSWGNSHTAHSCGCFWAVHSLEMIGLSMHPSSLGRDKALAASPSLWCRRDGLFPQISPLPAFYLLPPTPNCEVGLASCGLKLSNIPSFQFPGGENHQRKLEASSSSLPILIRVLSIQSSAGVAAEVAQLSSNRKGPASSQREAQSPGSRGIPLC